MIEKFVVGANKTIKRDWQLLEQPEQQEEEEETLESITRKEAKEAGRKLLTEGEPDETALVDIDVEKDRESFIPLPNGAENAGGRGERGFVRGFRVY